VHGASIGRANPLGVVHLKLSFHAMPNDYEHFDDAMRQSFAGLSSELCRVSSGRWKE
jgi:hypothetical protein